MTWFRFTIRGLMFAVVLVAADCAALAAFVTGRVDLGMVIPVLGTLPMANLLAIVTYRAWAGGSMKRPYFLGFVGFGAMAATLSIVVCLTVDDSTRLMITNWPIELLFSIPINPPIRAFNANHPFLVRVFGFVVVLPVILLAPMSLPQFLFALAGGWLVRRSALVLKRWSTAA